MIDNPLYSNQDNALLKELSIKFDLYYNNISSNQAPGLNEYEKSVFLTQGHEEIIQSLYNGSSTLGDSFEETEELRRYLSNLVVEARLKPIDNSSGRLIGISDDICPSFFFTLPYGMEEEPSEEEPYVDEQPEEEETSFDDPSKKPAVWFITYESVATTSTENKCGNAKNVDVVPVRQDEYRKIKRNPFRGLNDRKAFRLDLADNVVEIVSKNTVTMYYLRYVKRPYPIILEDLPDGFTINGYNKASTHLDVNRFLHQRIVEAAVTLALKSWNRQ